MGASRVLRPPLASRPGASGVGAAYRTQGTPRAESYTGRFARLSTCAEPRAVGRPNAFRYVMGRAVRHGAGPTDDHTEATHEALAIAVRVKQYTALRLLLTPVRRSIDRGGVSCLVSYLPDWRGRHSIVAAAGP